MNEQPLVSVIVSCYNHAPYIEECLLSILHQSYPNLELLVVDDGSDDGSVEIIKKLNTKYTFDFRAQANQGLVNTLNDCIARSRGSLVAPFGSDDVMLPDRIKIQVEYMQDKPEVGICAGNILSIDSEGSLLHKRNKTRPFRRLSFEDVFLGNKPTAPAPTLLFRREALETVGGFDPDIALEDLSVILKITSAGYAVDVLEETLAKYRKHPKNTYKNMRFMIENILKIYAQYASHPAYPEACARFINSMFLKSSKKDKRLARELFSQLPMKYWDKKTIRAFGRYLFVRAG